MNQVSDDSDDFDEKTFNTNVLNQKHNVAAWYVKEKFALECQQESSQFNSIEQKTLHVKGPQDFSIKGKKFINKGIYQWAVKLYRGRNFSFKIGVSCTTTKENVTKTFTSPLVIDDVAVKTFQDEPCCVTDVIKVVLYHKEIIEIFL